MPLRYVLFELAGLFDEESDRDISEDGLLWMLEALCQFNQLYLQKHPRTPKLYSSGVVYKVPEQVSGEDGPNIFRRGEHFRDIPAILENGGGDCDNVSCWRIAELRNAGYKGVRPYLSVSQERLDGTRVYHALVYWPTPKPKGSTEDPSLILGMGGVDRSADREEELRKNRERAEKIRDGIARAVLVGQVSPEAVRAAIEKKARFR